MDRETSGEMIWWKHARDNLKYFRKRNGWTQAELAERIGCGDGRIKGLEQGSIKFTQISLDDICCILNISIEQLFSPQVHYLERLSSFDHARVKNSIASLHSVMSSRIPLFSARYIAGIVNTFSYNQTSQRICYELVELMETNQRVGDHHDVIVKILKDQYEKECVSMAVKELLKEKNACCINFDTMKSKIPSVYKLLYNLIESYGYRLSSVIRIPVFIQDSMDVFGGIWCCFSEVVQLKPEVLQELTITINDIIWE